MGSSTKLVILGALGAILWSLWIVASVATVFFLYEALAHDSAWVLVLCSILASLMTRVITTSVFDMKRRLSYVGELMERGYVRIEAEAAWHVASNGGMNLLSNLHQTHLQANGPMSIRNSSQQKPRTYGGDNETHS